MIFSNEKLKEILVNPGYVSEEDFNQTQKDSEAQSVDLWTLLTERELIKDDQLGMLVANFFNFSFISLEKEKIDEDILNLIPEQVAREKGVIVFDKQEDQLKAAFLNPEDLESKYLIEKKTDKNLIVYFVTERDFNFALTKYRANLKSVFLKFFKNIKNENFSRSEKDELIVEIVDTLLIYGSQNKASDVHIEPYNDKALVRFRIDGVMHDILEIPKDVSNLILTRIKIMAKIRTDEHRTALDGKLKFDDQGESIDVRVSIIPVTEGENAVLRLLSSKSRQMGLTDLGMAERDLIKVREAANNPHGMIMVTGPTGSGKTTTVYAVMRIINTRDVHISTIEDPVEYEIPGVSQIQVNTQTGLTFAKGLRAIVRQDPDIIMVGEIRDEETADIAVNSAMTGHLVLSTLHANDSATTLPRLIDLKVEPYLVASTVNIVIAQRLVRRICPRCQTTCKLDESTKALIVNNNSILEILHKNGKDDLDNLILYKGAGCPVCRKTGFLGRIGIFETMEMKEEIRDLVIKKASSEEIAEKARSLGMISIAEDGIEKVLAGITTLDEVMRATKE